MDQRQPLLPQLLFFLSILFCVTPSSGDDVRNEPSEVIEASPLNPFSERADEWSYSQISGEDANSVSTNIYQSIGQIPGITAAGETPRLSIRGSSSLARILGLYDGIPMNLADGFGFSNLLVPNENLGEIKIIKGPASIFWGKDAMGGAINFLPHWRDRASVRAHTGSFGRMGIFGALPILRSDKKTGVQMTGYNESVSGNFPFESTTSAANGERAPNDQHLQRLTLNARQQGDRWGLAEDAIWAKEFAATPGSLYFPEVTRARRESTLVSLLGSYFPSSTVSGSYRVFGIRNNNQYETTSLAAPAMAESSVLTSRLGNSFSLKKNFSSFEGELFADHFHDELDASYLNNDHFQTNELEVGVLMTIPFQEWQIKPGVRYLEAYKSAVPALGVFQTFGGFSKWLTYSQGIRVPDLGQKFANTSYFSGNPDLKPEYSEQTELGFQQKVSFRPWEYYSYGVTAFSTGYRDFIAYDSSATPNLYRNIGHADASGAEGNAAYETDNWGVHGELAYTKSQDDQKNPLPLAPEIQAKAAAHYNWAILLFEFEDTMWGKYFETGNLERAGWNTLDFHVKTLALTDWEIKFSVFNIFDSPREIIRGFPEPQRRLWLSVERFL